MGEMAVQIAKAVDYHSAGTVEFLLDTDKKFLFYGNEYQDSGGTPCNRDHNRY